MVIMTQLSATFKDASHVSHAFKARKFVVKIYGHRIEFLTGNIYASALDLRGK